MRKLGIVFAFLVVVLVLAVTAMPESALLTAGEWAIYLALPAANGFPLLYSRRPWWRSQIGRALMTKAVGIAALFDLSALAQAFEWQVPLDVTVLVVGLVVTGIWYQFLVLCVTPRDRPETRRE